LHDVSFSLRKGEIVGLWGLLGSGRTELLRALIGARSDRRRKIAGAKARSSRHHLGQLRAHVGIVTEDTPGEGILSAASSPQNIALPNLSSLLNGGRLVSQQGKGHWLRHDQAAQIKVASAEQSVGTLSVQSAKNRVWRWLPPTTPLSAR